MIDLIVDLQYGSTGKGLLAGYLAEKHEHTGVITCNMPNAGHTYIDSKGNKMIHKVLPNGIVSPKLQAVFIGPGAVFSVDRLLQEIDAAQELGYLINIPIFIHPNAVPLKDSHTKMEGEMLNGIASTMQGSAAAVIEKMMRQPGKNTIWYDNMDDLNHPQIITPSHTLWMDLLGTHMKGRLLAEGSQGFSLGVNQRFWPYCTSRECTPHRLMSDMGLPSITGSGLKIHGTLRTFPIRVGNTPDGYSGDVYKDQQEKTWDRLGQTPEKTTVTQRVRRVFDFSFEQLEEALWHCRPHSLFLNFANYLGKNEVGELIDQINHFGRTHGCGVDHVGYGPAYGDVKEAE